MLTCSNCGHQVEATATYCPMCGTALAVPSEVATPREVLERKIFPFESVSLGGFRLLWLSAGFGNLGQWLRGVTPGRAVYAWLFAT